MNKIKLIGLLMLLPTLIYGSHKHNNKYYHNSNTLTNIHHPYIEAEEVVNTTSGKTVTLTCIIHNLKTYKIAWYHGGSLLALDTIRIKDDKRYNVENPTHNHWKLVISNVDVSDEGAYSCRLTNKLKKIINLKVGSAPKFIGNDSSQHQHAVLISVNEHDNLTINCEAYGNPIPTIKWYRNRQFIKSGVELFIENVTFNEARNEYECVAMNQILPDASRRFMIQVNVKPVVTLLNYTIESSQAEYDLNIICDIFGSPINSILWFKNSQLIKESNGFILSDTSSFKTKNDKYSSIENIIIDDINLQFQITRLDSFKLQSKLKFKNIDYRANGKYTCLVSGHLGETSKSIIINEITTTTTTEKTTTLEIVNIIETSAEESQPRMNSLSFGKHFQNIIETNQIISGREARSNITSARVHSSDRFNGSAIVSSGVLIIIMSFILGI